MFLRTDEDEDDKKIGRFQLETASLLNRTLQEQ
jgi:hypothetical protein